MRSIKLLVFLLVLLVVCSMILIRIGTDLIYLNDPKPVMDLISELFSTASNRAVLIGSGLIIYGFIMLGLILALSVLAYSRHEPEDEEDTEAHDIEEELTRLGSPPFDPKKTDG